MARLTGHRQTKGAATDKLDLRPPRHISTLPSHCRMGLVEQVTVPFGRF